MQEGVDWGDGGAMRREETSCFGVNYGTEGGSGGTNLIQPPLSKPKQPLHKATADILSDSLETQKEKQQTVR